MNTSTGEIKHFGPGEKAPAGWVPLKRLAKKSCPLCKGEGKKLVKRKGQPAKYEPCPCTQ